MATKEEIQEDRRLKQHLNKRNNTDVSFVDIDYAIQKYIENKIAVPFIDPENGENIEVDVFTKNPERWIEKKDMKIKDLTGNHYTFPIIGIARNGIDIRSDKVPHWLNDKDLLYNIGIFHQTTYDDEGKRVYKRVRRPVYIDANYEFEILSDLKRHTNLISEQFIYHEGKYWSDDETYSFKVDYKSVLDGSISADQGQERLIIASINATCSGYILPEFAEGDVVDEDLIQVDPKVEIDEKIVSSSNIRKRNEPKTIWD